jgi:SNF2 family DNA or RNA helicase
MHFLQPDKYDLLEQDFDLTDEDREAKIRELHIQLKDIMLRRLKKDVVQSLPSKSEQILRVEMSQMQVWWYKNILSKVGKRASAVLKLSDYIFPYQRIIQHWLAVIRKSLFSILPWS